MGGLKSCEKFKVHFAFAIRHCLTPSQPPTHAWSISRVGLSLYVFSFASLPKFECNFFRWNQLLIMYSFLLVFLDSVSSSWPVFMLLYLSFCVNKGHAACLAWHGSQLCVRMKYSNVTCTPFYVLLTNFLPSSRIFANPLLPSFRFPVDLQGLILFKKIFFTQKFKTST